MATIIYKIELLTNWHTGSGLYGGTDANLTVIKNRAGLPYIPGKTIKGLIREGAKTICALHPDLVTSDFIGDIFGWEDKKPNASFFGNAELSKYLSENIKDEQKPFLYSTIASTAIDANGLAQDKSLRQIETTVPLVLYGAIVDFPATRDSNPDYGKQLTYCLQWIKKLGYKRTKGFGRCVVSIHSINHA
jgi:CRISPR/Cas system CSM-associated protein Csm3 (group 7 of RAMP superfamily)